MYERFFGALPAEPLDTDEGRAAAKQAALEERLKRLITRKERGARPQAPPAAKPSGSGGSGGAARQPSRMVNAVSTMPGQKPWITAPARPGSGGSGGAPLTRRHSDENEQPVGGRLHHASQQSQAQPVALQEDGKLWRPQEAPRPSVSTQASQGRSVASRGSGGGAMSKMPASGAVLQRQIELKAALRPPTVEQPHKSPWRPPGRRVRNSAACAACMWLNGHPIFSCVTADDCLPAHFNAPLCRQEREGGAQAGAP